MMINDIVPLVVNKGHIVITSFVYICTNKKFPKIRECISQMVTPSHVDFKLIAILINCSNGSSILFLESLTSLRIDHISLFAANKPLLSAIIDHPTSGVSLKITFLIILCLALPEPVQQSSAVDHVIHLSHAEIGSPLGIIIIDLRLHCALLNVKIGIALFILWSKELIQSLCQKLFNGFLKHGQRQCIEHIKQDHGKA